jgi:hypothetical protein
MALAGSGFVVWLRVVGHELTSTCAITVVPLCNEKWPYVIRGMASHYGNCRNKSCSSLFVRFDLIFGV